MKKLIITICLILIFGGISFAEDTMKQDPCAECPYPTMKSDVYVVGDTGYFMLDNVIAAVFDKFYESCIVFDRYGVKKIVIVLLSPGGSLFEGIAFAQKMIEEIDKGRTIEIQAYGLVASAASIIMACGSKGHRYIAPNTILMIHELQIFEWGASLKSVADKEKEAEVVRFLQDNMTDFILPHINMTKEELEKRCKEESWANAKTAIKWGFADKLIDGTDNNR